MGDAVAGEQFSGPGCEFAELAEYLGSGAGAEGAAAEVFDFGLDEVGGVFGGGPVVHDREDVTGFEAFEGDVVADAAVGGAPCGDQAVPVADDLGKVAGVCCQVGCVGEVFAAQRLVAGVALAADVVSGAVDDRHEGDVAAFAGRAGDREEVVGEVALGESAVVAVFADPPARASRRGRAGGW